MLLGSRRRRLHGRHRVRGRHHGRGRQRIGVTHLGRRRQRSGAEVGDALTGDLGRPLPIGTEHPDVERPVTHPRLVQQPCRRVLQVAHDVEGGEPLQQVPGGVEFPPTESLAHRGGQVVVVVVPALTAGDDGDDERVPAGVRCGVAAAADDVGHRVDEEGAVPQQDGRQEEADQQAAPAEEQERGDPEGPRSDPVVLLQPAQFGVGGEVLDAVEVRLLVLGRQDPADMAPPEPFTGRVHVAVEIGVAVVDPMVARPPEGALLDRHGATEGHQELGDPPHLVAAVGEIAVVAGGDAEHPGHVEDGTQHPVLPGDRDEEGGQRGQVHAEERDGRHPVGARLLDGGRRSGGLGVRGGCGHG